MTARGFPIADIRSVNVRLMEENADDDRFLQLARPIAPFAHCVFLLSGGPLRTDSINRYSLAAWNPHLVLRTRGDGCTLSTGRETFSTIAPPLSILDKMFLDGSRGIPFQCPPFSGGALGYFSYDLKNSLEKLPTSASDPLGLPDIYLMWPRRLLIHDRATRRIHEMDLRYEPYDDTPHDEHERCAGDDGGAGDPCGLHGLHGTTGQKERASNPLESPWPLCEWDAAFRVGPLQSNFTRKEYLTAVEKVRDYIRAGDAYQVNLSQRFDCAFQGNPFDLWVALFRRNPAPFYAFVNAGDHQVVSTSMERFLRLEGGLLETRPIKGTRPRGKTEEEDRALAHELLDHPKDDAELSMIVDLERNDLGRVCAPRTVRVIEHKRLESYRNVHHLVSIVTGEPIPRTTLGDILKAAFPGGSITGCPKIRAIEIIDEIEPHARHIYTGSLGYLGIHGNMDLSIAIRTALVHRGRLYFSVGGGIVYDSDPREEYEETLHKGLTFFQTLQALNEEAP